jgi:hypothetical protein
VPARSADQPDAFRWQTQPAAAALVAGWIGDALSRCPEAARLAGRLHAGSGTRLADWADHLMVGDPARLDARLAAAGFRDRGDEGAPDWHVHPGGGFPEVVVMEGERLVRLAVAVDSCADFLAAHGLDAVIEGGPGAGLRRARAWAAPGAELWVAERHGNAGHLVDDASPEQVVAALRQLEAFRLRPRVHADEAAWDRLEALVGSAIAGCGRDRACELFFAAEREHWQRRNRAAQAQKARQDALGMGWANHDHHTYRSSRRWFIRLIALLERLGFACRERFHPGGGAGWGAQVLEHPVTGIVIFADVDMSPEELRGDFAHQPFAGDDARRPLGTVGLWCALHGESLFAAGLHHLACAVDFAAAREQLAALGVPSMKPFSELPHLRQCFTEGERWSVAPERLAPLLRAGQITAEQEAQFRAQGALGSHLELVERNQGFKGFNQHGVDEIIAGTDPRTARG